MHFLLAKNQKITFYYQIYLALRHTQLFPIYHKFASLFNAHLMCMNYMGNLLPVYSEA